MSVFDYFKPVSTWPAQKIRGFLSQESQEEYNLVDVREPKEYEQGH
jgi:rhodanese-related sulfurtransferase